MITIDILPYFQVFDNWRVRTRGGFDSLFCYKNSFAYWDEQSQMTRKNQNKSVFPRENVIWTTWGLTSLWLILVGTNDQYHLVELIFIVKYVKQLFFFRSTCMFNIYIIYISILLKSIATNDSYFAWKNGSRRRDRIVPYFPGINKWK